MTPEAFLFDMDGLLLDTERVAQATFAACAADAGAERDAAAQFFLGLIGTSEAVTRARVAAYLPDTDIAAFAADWDAALAARLDQYVPLRPHVAQVIPGLAAQGATMAVVTSTSGARARHHLAKAGLLRHFAAVLGGDEVRANKPDPAPYQDAAARLGVAPTRCAAFEDSDIGVTAAVKAGCRAVQIPDLRPEDVPLPDLGQAVAPDLRAALALFGIAVAA
ncbi:MAG: HAD family phosphatase [Pseudomonadota bacterium]